MPSVDDCHFKVDVPTVAHVPPVAVKVTPTRAGPLMTGAAVLTGASRPGVVPLPAVVDPFVRSAT